MATLNDIIQSDNYAQFETNEVYQAAQLLLQQFQKTNQEPEKLEKLIDHLKKQLEGQAAYPLAVLLECGQLGIRHQLLKEWNSPLKQRQLFLFESIHFQFRGKVPPIIWNQICLNYAETLIHLGRSIEGLQVVEEMIEADDDPAFSRKEGERGWGLVFYSAFLRDPVEKAEALHAARSLLRRSHEKIDDESGRAFYAERLKLAETMLNKLGPVDVTGYKPNFFDGREKDYRDWCAEHKLLLNGTNEIDPGRMMKVDALRYKPKGVDKNQDAFLIRHMDALVSEYTALRWTLFEALHQKAEEPNKTEQLKNVFRQAFSLFDKIASFLNHYYKLGVPEQRLSMQRIWFEDDHPTKPLKPFIRDSENGALKALYWQSKELFGYEKSEQQSILMLRAFQLRQQLEKSFVQVINTQQEVATEGELRKHQMTQKELERLAMLMASRARNGLMYLGFSLG
ncbi:LA2681 family HEPN domain-containing protein [Planococcus sp. YIM B11945]|uniref:LA2681 family HEPN domain-containing protein n=1 Tax=Planococcus sp. YIM B11945 TaxID=3435410 RepID=UPI003D7ECFAA